MKNSFINDPHVFGHIFENFVATEILKQLVSIDGVAELHHFRTSDGKEVDFVLERLDGRIAAIEVKGRDSVATADFKGLNELRRQTENDFICGIVLYRGNKIIPFDDNMWAVPVGALWI
jgi:predicted AAA+ superfamily ATPase